MLTNVRIVLVETTHPGNIGAVARAMKNMCLTRLHLVAPRIFPSAEATARASGADDVLARAVIDATLDDAIQDCALVIGASARPRTIACPQLSPRACAERVLQEGGAAPVALVFGREHSGLSNAELDRCHCQLVIPTDPAFASLNLAGAVQIAAYELLVAARSAQAPAEGAQELATAEDMDRFYQHLEQVLVQIGFLDPANPRQLMRRLRRLYNRIRPDRNEMNILRGILTAVQDRAGRGG